MRGGKGKHQVLVSSQQLAVHVGGTVQLDVWTVAGHRHVALSSTQQGNVQDLITVAGKLEHQVSSQQTCWSNRCVECKPFFHVFLHYVFLSKSLIVIKELKII